MNWLEKVVGYFVEDPLRIVTILGGSGGLIYWFDRFMNRTRVKIKLLHLDITHPTDCNYMFMKFEAENIGSRPNSLLSTVVLSGITPNIVPNSTRERHRYLYIIKGIERELPSCKPVLFEACTKWNESMRFLWFIKIYFETTRGRGKTIYLRSFSKEQIGFLNFYYERFILYGIFNKLNIDAS